MGKIGKMIKKHEKIVLYILATVLVLFNFSFKSLSSYADNNKAVNEIDNKLEEQNEDILDMVKKNGMMDNEKKIDKIMDLMENSKYIEKENKSLSEIKNEIVKSLFNIALTLRKYIVPFYMFILLSNILLLSILGSKSLAKRKAYVVGSFSLTAVFVVLMNIPLIVIYFQNNPFSEVITIDSIYKSVYKLVYFLRENRMSICVILAVYGIINLQLGKNDIPRKTTGNYFIKTAYWMFIIFTILPTAINFIL